MKWNRNSSKSKMIEDYQTYCQRKGLNRQFISCWLYLTYYHLLITLCYIYNFKYEVERHETDSLARMVFKGKKGCQAVRQSQSWELLPLTRHQLQLGNEPDSDSHNQDQRSNLTTQASDIYDAWQQQQPNPPTNWCSISNDKVESKRLHLQQDSLRLQTKVLLESLLLMEKWMLDRASTKTKVQLSAIQPGYPTAIGWQQLSQEVHLQEERSFRNSKAGDKNENIVQTQRRVWNWVLTYLNQAHSWF